MEDRVYLDDPNLGPLEKEYLNTCIESTFVSTVGPFVNEFEEKFARYIGINRAVALQSGTAALHMSLHALGIGSGDEVIVPSLTFIATVNPVIYVGAQPVIVDVEPGSWNINPEEVEKAVTPRTKAIIPVHLYGNPCNMDALLEIARKYKLKVIEDATESLGALYQGQQTGTFGDFGCFSFNGNKLITTGGGGMIVTRDEQKADWVFFLINQARDQSKGYFHPEMGFNYRMTNIEAALGIGQLSRVEEFLACKRSFRKIYEEVLGDIPGVRFQLRYDGVQASDWFTCITASGRDAGELAGKLRQEGIPTRRIFLPLGDMPYLSRFAKPCLNAKEIYRTGLCLPGSTLNTIEAIEKAALTVRRMLVA